MATIPDAVPAPRWRRLLVVCSILSLLGVLSVRILGPSDATRTADSLDQLGLAYLIPHGLDQRIGMGIGLAPHPKRLPVFGS